MIEKWKVFEHRLTGTAEGNPYQDVWLKAVFEQDREKVSVNGFYCGDGTYKIRFMPGRTGIWHGVTESNDAQLNNISLVFECEECKAGNHGRVLRKTDVFQGQQSREDKYQFSYEDGAQYLPFGTTCYAWVNQPLEVQEQTLAQLAGSPFNKVRMCIFPKYYTYNTENPEHYPFQGSEEDGFDFTRFNEMYWENLEKRIAGLDELGIQADIILLHPYDKWGFAKMDRETDLFYLKYVADRLCHYKNVWWSMANEYDLLPQKSIEDWELYAKTVAERDVYGHLNSIHNCLKFYDYTKPWITHCSMQRIDVYKTAESVTQWREIYEKPIVVDECAYEGNIDYGWGNITGEEMTRRFWEGCVRGGFLSHGETYVDKGQYIWWAHGGKLYGTSPERICFLKKVMEEVPDGAAPLKLTPENHEANWDAPCLCKGDEYFLYYYGFFRPLFRRYELPEGRKYEVELVDTWEMTVTKVPGVCSGSVRIDLPGKEYMAVRMKKVN